jgi:myo-inositol-1(or 4)-monophosphatase
VVAGQYHHDQVADAAVLAVLDGAGFGVFSEESGVHHPERPLLVVVDPVDGSTNASRGLPWWAVSLCALDEEGPLAAVVLGVPTHERFEAVRGEGARRNGQAVRPSAAVPMDKAVVSCNGYPPWNFGWSQYRALGSAALELCLVACGVLDGFVDFSGFSLAPWDYLGALLVCSEAGAVAQDAFGRDLDVRQPGPRRAVVAANTQPLLDELLAIRARAGN